MKKKNTFIDENRHLIPCRTADSLHKWIFYFLGVNVPRRAVCPHHSAPFDYLVHSYFEPAKDIVVWAPRGGGKTRLAAIATLLDLLHKPGVSVTLLGGSLGQSLRVWEHLLPDLERLASDQLIGKSRTRSVRLTNTSKATAIAQSQFAVRGLRVQKLRCDELELFDPDVLEAAKLTTRSLQLENGKTVAGTMEALSTMHASWGLMHDLIEQAAVTGTPVVKWCVLDVLETCPPARDCNTCPLWEDCRGLAKNADGFLPIDDAIRLKQRSSAESWDAEMLCKRPSVKGSVFPTFDTDVHVREDAGAILRFTSDTLIANEGSFRAQPGAIHAPSATANAFNIAITPPEGLALSQKAPCGTASGPRVPLASQSSLSPESSVLSPPSPLSPQSSHLSPTPLLSTQHSELSTTTLSLAIDFGFSNPFACLWIIDDGRVVHVLDEYVQSGRTMEEHLSVIESRPWGRVKYIACDPAGNSRNDQTAESNVHLLRRRQYTVKTRRSLIIDGLELIRRGLKTAAGDVSLFVHPRCRNLVRALKSYHYPTGFNSELPFKDGENDHLIDALRYFYVNRSSRAGREAFASRKY